MSTFEWLYVDGLPIESQDQIEKHLVTERDQLPLDEVKVVFIEPTLDLDILNECTPIAKKYKIAKEICDDTVKPRKKKKTKK